MRSDFIMISAAALWCGKFVKGYKMAEIKSTLDLVMERTRGLSLSDREKNELRSRELEARINSALEKFVSEYQTMKWIKNELGSLNLGANPEAGEALKSAILARINVNGENSRLFDVLEKVLGIDTKPYKKVVTEFRKIYASEGQKNSKRILDGLAARKISGSAVKPNPASDPAWMDFSEKLAADFQDRIKSV